MRLEQERGAEHGRCVEIMAAGMHLAGAFRRVRQPRRLRDWQRVDVGAERDDGRAPADLGHESGLHRHVQDADAVRREDVAHVLRRFRFFERQLGMAVHPLKMLAQQRAERRASVFFLRYRLHRGHPPFASVGGSGAAGF